MGNIIFPKNDTASGLIVPQFEVLEPKDLVLIPTGSSLVSLKSGARFAIGTDLVEIESDTNFPANTGFFWVDRLGNLGVTAAAPIEQVQPPAIEEIVDASIPLFSGPTANGFTISASSTYSPPSDPSNFTQYPPWKAHDGINIETGGWISQRDNTSGRWVLQMPAVQRLCRVDISTRDSIYRGNPDIFTIEQSPDGTNWTVLGSYNVGRVWGQAETIRFDFTECTAPYISIHVSSIRRSPELASVGQSYITIGETRWYAKQSLPDNTVWKNPVTQKFYELQSGDWVEIESRLLLGEILPSETPSGFDPAKVNSPTVLSENNGLATFSSGRSVFGFVELLEDRKYYFEIEVVSGFTGPLDSVGIGAMPDLGVGYATDHGVSLRSTGVLNRTDKIEGISASLGSYDTYTAGDTIGVACDGDSIWISKNGLWLAGRSPGQNSLAVLPDRVSPIFPFVYAENSSARLKTDSLSYPVSGFQSLNVNLIRYKTLAIQKADIAANTDTAIAHDLGTRIATWTANLPSGATGGVVSQTRSTVTVRSSIAGTVEVIGVKH